LKTVAVFKFRHQAFGQGPAGAFFRKSVPHSDHLDISLTPVFTTVCAGILQRDSRLSARQAAAQMPQFALEIRTIGQCLLVSLRGIKKNKKKQKISENVSSATGARPHVRRFHSRPPRRTPGVSRSVPRSAMRQLLSASKSPGLPAELKCRAQPVQRSNPAASRPHCWSQVSSTPMVWVSTFQPAFGEGGVELHMGLALPPRRCGGGAPPFVVQRFFIQPTMRNVSGSLPRSGRRNPPAFFQQPAEKFLGEVLVIVRDFPHRHVERRVDTSRRADGVQCRGRLGRSLFCRASTTASAVLGGPRSVSSARACHANIIFQ